MLNECSKTELRSKIEARCNAKGFTLQDIDFTYERYPSKTYKEEILKNIRKELVEDALDGFIESMKAIKLTKEEVLEIIKERY